MAASPPNSTVTRVLFLFVHELASSFSMFASHVSGADRSLSPAPGRGALRPVNQQKPQEYMVEDTELENTDLAPVGA
jgi:hypothetical protein